MGRLAKGPSRLERGPHRIETRVASSEPERDRLRAEDNPLRKLYWSARWRKLVKKIRIRDNYVCQQTGVKLIGKRPAPNSPVVDHKIPHGNDERLFWDESNLQLVSKAWHDGAKQKEDKARRRGGR